VVYLFDEVEDQDRKHIDETESFFFLIIFKILVLYASDAICIRTVQDGSEDLPVQTSFLAI